MTVIDAAEMILKEHNRPLTAKELAMIMLQRNLVNSNAKDKETSIIATIIKSIKIYDDSNFPLCYMDNKSKNRLVGLKIWKDSDKIANEIQDNSNPVNKKAERLTIHLNLSKELVDNLKFINQLNNKLSFEELIENILYAGLKSNEKKFKEEVRNKLNNIYN